MKRMGRIIVALPPFGGWAAQVGNGAQRFAIFAPGASAGQAAALNPITARTTVISAGILVWQSVAASSPDNNERR